MRELRYFAKEKDMLETVQDWLRPQVTSMETELGCGYAACYIPDLVGIKFEMAKVVNLKRQNPMSRCRIKDLIKVNRVPEMFYSDLVAVELKLRNFVQAFFQAKKYAYFGFRSYIAMPEPFFYNKLDRIRREVMEQDGIGFLQVGEECKEMIKARPAVHFSIEDKIQISDRMICKFRKGKSAPALRQAQGRRVKSGVPPSRE